MNEFTDHSNQFICVLGMHRSGTSCLAGCLEESGINFGEVSNFSQYNRKGNKENTEINKLNEELLAYNNGSWDNPPDKILWDEDLASKRNALILSNEYKNVSAFKDPRTILTLEFWLEKLRPTAYIGTFRHPNAVIKSLLGRKGLEPKTNPLKLWIIYNQKLLHYSKEYQFPLICFDQDLKSYQNSMRRVLDYLHIKYDQNHNFDFIDQELKRHCADDSNNASIGAKETLIYHELLKRAI